MRPALRLSLAANMVLLAVIGALLLRDGRESTRSVTAHVPAAAPAPTRTDPVPPAPADDAPPRLTRAVVERLEATGIPRDVVVDVLLHDFSRRWDKRAAELERKYRPKPVPPREYVELGRLRDAEQIRELKQALGEDGYLAWDREQTLRMLNTGGIRLDGDEAAAAYRLQKDFDRRYRELQMAMEDGLPDPADTAALQEQARQHLDRELEKLLGPQRLAELRGITDPIAEATSRFAHLGPTPEQAKAALAAEERFRESEAALAARLQANSGEAVNLVAELNALHEAREQHLRLIFGADAYNAAKRENDPLHRNLQQYAEAWGFQPHDVQSVYGTLSAFQELADRTRSAGQLREAAGRKVNWQEIDLAIEQSRLRMEAELTARIGAERLRRLKQNGVLGTR